MFVQYVSACGAVHPPSFEQMRSQIRWDLHRRQSPPQEEPTNQNNETHWTVAENKRQMQVSDDAFIARDLAHFNHHPNVTVYMTGGVVYNLTEHLEDMRLDFSIYSDVAPHNHDYKILFGEGDWTVAVSQVSAIQNGPLPSLQGTLLPPTNKPVQMDLMTIARWNNGWMMEEFLWSDAPLMYRQLGVLPSRPSNNLPDLELNLATPLSTTPGVNNSTYNKALASELDDTFNAGNFSVESMKLSPNASVYGLTDEPLDAESYIAWLKDLKMAFPDLRIENKPYRQIIGEGDWTAAVAFLSGTHTGNLTLPPYLAETPIAPTGKKFDLLHFTIARWQDDKIVGLRVNMDLFGIVRALGIPL
ncbi:hypothetical protein E8E14_007300 [Neopestalotiopsis sp. 37M]|nr:hypothetical protein E8E14_007300 [Neopestalotiopsis sp. 37M]